MPVNAVSTQKAGKYRIVSKTVVGAVYWSPLPILPGGFVVSVFYAPIPIEGGWYDFDIEHVSAPSLETALDRAKHWLKEEFGPETEMVPANRRLRRPPRHPAVQHKLKR